MKLNLELSRHSLGQLRGLLRRIRSEYIPTLLVHHQRLVRWLILIIVLAGSVGLVIHLHLFVTADSTTLTTSQAPTLDTTKLNRVLGVIESRDRRRESGLPVRSGIDLTIPSP